MNYPIITFAAALLAAPAAIAAAPQYFNFNDAAPYGYISVSASGACTAATKQYAITEISARHIYPNSLITDPVGIELIIKGDMGNLMLRHTVLNSKDKASFAVSDSSAKISFSSSEKSFFEHLIRPYSNQNRYPYFVKGINPDFTPVFENQGTDIHNFFGRLKADINFDGPCKDGRSLRETLGFNQAYSFRPLYNDNKTKVKTSYKYSAALNNKTAQYQISNQYQTQITLPLEQLSNSCHTKTAVDSGSPHRFSCAAASPINLNIAISLKANELLSAGL